MGSINSTDRIAVTLYSLGTWFVSGIIYIQVDYILHEEDSDNNNNNNNNNIYIYINISN
jgi:hypothetical protein